MRKSGENNAKFSERSCDRSTKTNDFTLGFESQSMRYTGGGPVWISVVVHPLRCRLCHTFALAIQ